MKTRVIISLLVIYILLFGNIQYLYSESDTTQINDYIKLNEVRFINGMLKFSKSNFEDSEAGHKVLDALDVLIDYFPERRNDYYETRAIVKYYLGQKGNLYYKYWDCGCDDADKAGLDNKKRGKELSLEKCRAFRDEKFYKTLIWGGLGIIFISVFTVSLIRKKLTSRNRKAMTKMEKDDVILFAISNDKQYKVTCSKCMTLQGISDEELSNKLFICQVCKKKNIIRI